MTRRNARTQLLVEFCKHRSSFGSTGDAVLTIGVDQADDDIDQLWAVALGLCACLRFNVLQQFRPSFSPVVSEFNALKLNSSQKTIPSAYASISSGLGLSRGVT